MDRTKTEKRKKKLNKKLFAHTNASRNKKSQESIDDEEWRKTDTAKRMI